MERIEPIQPSPGPLPPIDAYHVKVKPPEERNHRQREPRRRQPKQPPPDKPDHRIDVQA